MKDYRAFVVTSTQNHWINILFTIFNIIKYNNFWWCKYCNSAAGLFRWYLNWYYSMILIRCCYLVSLYEQRKVNTFELINSDVIILQLKINFIFFKNSCIFFPAKILIYLILSKSMFVNCLLQKTRNKTQPWWLGGRVAS